MNWIIILLLFGCCGNHGNNSFGCDRKCGERNRECKERDERSRNEGYGRGEERRSRNNNCECECRRTSENDCGCARESAREAVRDAKEAIRDAREAIRDAKEQCDNSGMVPPPWQDYPPMPRRDSRREDRYEERRNDCDCNK